MDKFICFHTLPRGAMSAEQVCQLADAAQHEADVRGYRSFLNLTEGKACCILEAKDREAIAAWFDKMQVPYDWIVPLEFEGERGVVHDLRQELVKAGSH
jgi:hypothetical protein